MKERGKSTTFVSIFDNGLAHLKEGKDEVEGQKDDLSV
jgi:hypothetical protein